MLSDKIIRLRCRERNDSNFIARYLGSRRAQNQLRGRKSGLATSQTNISQSDLKSVPITLPPLPEQRKIASFLTAVDGRIGQLIQKKALLEDYKKGVMQQLFSQAIRFKDDHGNDFPDWETIPLGDVSAFKNGKPHEPNVVKGGKYKLITLDSVSIKGRLKERHKTVNIDDASLRYGDIVVVLSDIAHAKLLGLTSVIPSDGYVLNQRMGRLRLSPAADPFFCSIQINMKQKFFRRRGQGTSQKHIYERDVSSLDFQLPDISEQKKIADFLSAIDRKIESVATQIIETQTFKRGLLQQMFV
jgi:type I restriction enzyme S subunit